MSSKSLSPLAAAALLGLLTGSRSATPLATLAAAHDRPELRGAWRDWPVFRSPLGRGGLVLGAVGELVGDKLPQTPSRLAPQGLVGRTVAGAIVGGAVGGTGRHPDALAGALIGGAGALVGSLLGAVWRAGFVRVTGAPDAVGAVLEDAVAIAGSATVVARL